MNNENVKKKLVDLKKRADVRKNTLPSVKSEKDLEVENQNAVELMPYVYKIIARY